MYVYSNNGISFRAVAPGYTPAAGEVVFPRIQDTENVVDNAALVAAFPNFAAAYAGKLRRPLLRSASTALNKSDVTITRTLAAGQTVGSDWLDYRAALRAIVNGSDTTSQELPATPNYPEGT